MRNACTTGLTSVMTTFSLLFRTAARVQLNEPVMTITLSMIANLWCIWCGVWSSFTAMPALRNCWISLPWDVVCCVSVIIRTFFPLLCSVRISLAMSLQVIVNTQISMVFFVQRRKRMNSVSDVFPWEKSQCFLLHFWPWRQGNAGSGKKSTLCCPLDFPGWWDGFDVLAVAVDDDVHPPMTVSVVSSPKLTQYTWYIKKYSQM